MTARMGSARPRIALLPEQRRQLAQDLGVHLGTLSGYFTGNQRPSFPRALLMLRHPLVRGSGLTLEDLLGHDIPPDVRVWSFDDDHRLAERAALATDHQETADAA